ncbi:MAG: hypothetical protein P4L20_19010 [Acidimicrobiales bacterium]|nr:hypothetical protein [Acidimicrobiales bacterium]
MPKLTVESNRTVGLIAGFLIPYLHEHGMAEGVEIQEAADFLARMILSYISSPGHWDLGDPEQVATLGRTELLAGVVAEPRPAGP